MFHKDARTLETGIRGFTADLYHQLAAGKGNLFFSPISIATALLLIHTAARGQTRKEIEQALKIDLPEDTLHAAYSRLRRELAERDTRYDPEEHRWHFHEGFPDDLNAGDYLLRLISAANIWLQSTYPCEREFQRIAGEVFGAHQQCVDFAGNPDDAAAAINGWVNNLTAGRIGQIISSDTIQPLTRLVLASTAYFKAGWSTAFQVDLTEPATFHRLDGREVEVPMMFIYKHFAYARYDDFQVVELPYVSGGIGLSVVLPDEGRFEAVERSFDAERLDEVLFTPSSFDGLQVRLRLPRFRIDAESDLLPLLTAIGIQSLFDPSAADLTGLSPEPELYVGQVLHKTFISVDEEGTEAAAATMLSAVAAGVPRPDEPVQFTCDRPFLFFITDDLSRSILFAGRLTEPAGAAAV